MQLQLKQLIPHLKNKLAPVYLISGDVPLLAQEASDAICEAAKAADFQRCDPLHIETGFNWEKFTIVTQNLDLFSAKNLIEIRNPKAKFDESGTKLLLHYLKVPPPDRLLIISTNKLTSAQKKTRWYKAVDKVGISITIWPISSQELPQWIRQRVKALGLTANQESIQLLADFTEGNLLATQQTLEKLRLLYPNSHITETEMKSTLIDHTRFNIFDLTHTALQADSTKVIRIIATLRNTDIEPTLILWALTQEIRTLINLKHQLQQGISMMQVLSSQWQSKKLAVKTALIHITLESLMQLLQLAQQIDLTIKGITTVNVWDQITQLSLGLSGCKTFLMEKHDGKK